MQTGTRYWDRGTRGQETYVCPMPLPQHVAHRIGAFAPKPRGILDSHAVVLDPQVAGPIRVSSDDQSVISCVLQGRGKRSTQVPIAEAFGHQHGRLANDHRPRSALDPRGPQWAGHEDQMVLRIESPDLGPDLLPVHPGCNAAPAEEACRIVHRIHGSDPVVTEINPEDLSGLSEDFCRHSCLPGPEKNRGSPPQPGGRTWLPPRC